MHLNDTPTLFAILFLDLFKSIAIHIPLLTLVAASTSLIWLLTPIQKRRAASSNFLASMMSNIFAAYFWQVSGKTPLVTALLPIVCLFVPLLNFIDGATGKAIFWSKENSPQGDQGFNLAISIAACGLFFHYFIKILSIFNFCHTLETLA